MDRLDKLNRRVKSKLDELKAAREMSKKPERQQIIDSAIDFVSRMDYWCEVCQADFTATGHKRVITVYDPPVAFYEGHCPKRHRCRRRITDQASDPYYTHSRVIKEMRQRYRRDFLQPHEAGFKTLYGDPMKGFYEKLEASERAQWQRKPSVSI